jgi:hypothetical protein
MTSESRDLSATNQSQRSSAPDARADPAAIRRPVVSTGNPRVMVAFPFSKIEVHEPSDEVRGLAAVVWALAEEVAALVKQTAPSQAEAADLVAAQATLLLHRLGAVTARHPDHKPSASG